MVSLNSIASWRTTPKPMQPLDGGVEERVVNAQPRPPRQPGGDSAGDLARGGEPGEGGDGVERRLDRFPGPDGVEDALEHQRLERADGGADQGQQNHDGRGAAVRSGEPERAAKAARGMLDVARLPW
jgi:hypothetical protein